MKIKKEVEIEFEPDEIPINELSHLLYLNVFCTGHLNSIEEFKKTELYKMMAREFAMDFVKTHSKNNN